MGILPFIFSTCLFLQIAPAFPIHSTRHATPRHAIAAKLNDISEIATVDVAEMGDFDADTDDFAFDDQPWNDQSGNLTSDDVWLPYPLVLNTTEIPDMIANVNKTLSMIQNLIEMLSQALNQKNSTTDIDFTFTTHVQLPPLSCPSDATHMFNQALLNANPGKNITSRAVRSGSVLCDDDCPCSSASRRKMATTTLEIQTVSSTDTLHMPTRREFPMAYEISRPS